MGAAPPLPQPCVLVVDDDGATRALYVLTLERAGLRTLQASDGVTALALLRRHDVDLVLLDQTMPGMLGTDVLRALRADERTRTTPAILVTGHTDVSDRVRGLDAGATDYLSKPVDPDELVARVKAHLRGRATWLALVARQLDERARVVAALCQIPPEIDAPAVARRICNEVLAVAGVTGAALIAFDVRDRALPLACAGRFASAFRDEALPAELGRHLRDRAAAGPFLASVREPAEALLSAEGAPVACAPLCSDGRVLGLLALAAGPGAPGPIDSAATALSVAIDAAGVASALLVGALTQRDALQSQRAAVQRIVEEAAFDPVFQPIVELDDRAVVGYELLTRFRDGASPQVRFADAARAGMAAQLEAATMAAGVQAAAGLPGGAHLSVNVSAPFVADARIAALLSSSDRPVVLEITEHEPVADYGALRAAVERLGPDVRMSVDDTGAGYASLQHILALQPAFVKLDRNWVAGIDSDTARQALVAGLASFAARTECELIAEGIEEEKELLALRDLGVGLGQGYLLGRPAPVAV